MIEEMAKDIVKMAGLGVYEKAEYLFNQCYRNCKDKVVLSKEEYSDYLILKNNYDHAKDEAERLQADNERLYNNLGKF